MHRRLNTLQELVPVRHDFSISVRAYACSQSDLRPRLQIEAILFRASAMLQDDKHMVLGIKDGTIIRGVVNNRYQWNFLSSISMKTGRVENTR